MPAGCPRVTIVDLSLPIRPHVRWKTEVTLVSNPLKLEGGDGAPARAIAILDGRDHAPIE